MVIGIIVAIIVAFTLINYKPLIVSQLQDPLFLNTKMDLVTKIAYQSLHYITKI